MDALRPDIKIINEKREEFLLRRIENKHNFLKQEDQKIMDKVRE